VATSLDMLGGEASNAATLYDPDGVSNSESCQLVVSNVTSLKSRRSASDLTSGLLVADTPVVIGQIVQSETFGWFLIAKVQNLSSVLLMPTPVKLQLLPLTDLLTFQRPTQTPPDPSIALSGYGEPMETGIGGYPVLPIEQFSVRVGYSNHLDSLTVEDIGPVPTTGKITLYAPLLCGVKNADSVTINGVPYAVQQVNPSDNSGTPFGLQIMLDDSAGPGYAPPS